MIAGIRNKENNKTILDYLKDDGIINRNFMQLINDDDLSFKEVIRDAQIIDTEEDLHTTVYNLPGSPAIKKGIYQSIKIVDEITRVMKGKPNNIVIEMARENQSTAKGRRNSKQRLKRLEESLKSLKSDLLKDNPGLTNEDLQNEKLYLYFLQNGKDMYTNKNLDIEHLHNYDVDHIIPQSFIKDDSIDNKVLVSNKKNRGKSDNVPSIEVVNRNIATWTRLLDSKLMSQRKFDNLTKAERGGLTKDDQARFIKRQLVETRQITKHVAQLLDSQMNDEFDTEKSKVKIITLKSSLTSNFRKTFGLYKVREINNYHHAHDAYLNAVIGTALLKKYPKLEPEFVYGDYPKFHSYRARVKATDKLLAESNIMKFFSSNDKSVNEDGELIWNAQAHIPTIKKVLYKSQVNIVKKTEVQNHGIEKSTGRTYGFYNENAKSKSDKLIPLKNGERYKKTEQYGGYSGIVNSYSIFFEGKKERGKMKNLKTVKKILGIPLLDRQEFENNPIHYLEDLGYSDISTDKIIKLPKYSLFELENGKRRMMASAKELIKANEFVLDEELHNYLYLAKHFERLDDDQLNYFNDHLDNFDSIMDQVETFSKQFIKADSRLENIKSLFSDNLNVPLEERCESFINLLTFTSSGSPADFKFYDKNISRKRYTSVNECLKGILIQQSVTGLFETRTDLEVL